VNDRWRTIAIALALILALLGVVAAAVVLSGGPGSTILPSPTTAAGGSNPPSSGDSNQPSSGPSAAPSSTPAGSPSTGSSPTPQVNLTTITFTSMRLDPQNGSAVGLARTFAFQTEGPGSVVAAMKSTITSGRTIICLKPAGGSSVCRTSTAATLTGTTTLAKTSWTITAIGSGTDSPTLDISLSFGTAHPSVTLTNGRFDGTAFPYDGATFRLTARTGGTISVKANWGAHPFDYALLVEPASTPPHDVTSSGNAPGATAAFPAVAGTAYDGTLANLEGGFGTTGLTMTVSWP
jgi:hypothetical protein